MNTEQRYPPKATIVDVCMRDGLQNVKDFVPTEKKLAIIDKLVEAGVSGMEITSFVSPKAVPQLADSAEVARAVREKYPLFRAIALAPNARGAQNASECGLQEVTYVLSASESHNQANVKKSIAESFDNLAAVRDALPDMRIRLSLATSFSCPFEGKTPVAKAMELAGRALNLGVGEVIFCDTIGVASPVHVAQVAMMAKKEWPNVSLGMHLHDTHGMGLANALAAMQQGITLFESSAGGLGGCPFAPGASGNTATEDMVNMLGAMGIDAGISLVEFLDAVAYIRDNVNAQVTSCMLKACRREQPVN